LFGGNTPAAERRVIQTTGVPRKRAPTWRDLNAHLCSLPVTAGGANWRVGRFHFHPPYSRFHAYRAGRDESSHKFLSHWKKRLLFRYWSRHQDRRRDGRADVSRKNEEFFKISVAAAAVLLH